MEPIEMKRKLSGHFLTVHLIIRFPVNIEPIIIVIGIWINAPANMLLDCAISLDWILNCNLIVSIQYLR